MATLDVNTRECFRRGRLFIIRSFQGWHDHANFLGAYPLIPLLKFLGPLLLAVAVFPFSQFHVFNNICFNAKIPLAGEA